MGKNTIRRDNKGRVLRTGEQQRKDGQYMYTYKDSATQKKVYLYSWRLEKTDRQPVGKMPKEALRVQIDELKRKQLFGDTVSDMTIEQAVEMYIAGRTGVRDSTKKGYKTTLKFLREQPFYRMKVGALNILQAKALVASWQTDLNKSYSQIHNYVGVLRPCYRELIEANIAFKNPFDFKLSSAIVNNSKKRDGIKLEDMRIYLRYVKEDAYYSRYYNMIYILFFTGVRVSELCGITIKDIDFRNRKLSINKQLIRDDGGKYIVIPLKGKRYDISRTINLSDELTKCFSELVEKRTKLQSEMVVLDIQEHEHSGFLFLDKDDTPCVATNIESRMRWCYNKYDRLYKHYIPRITPHVCRHTFGNMLYQRGVSLKSAQYILGHSTPDITARIYTDCDNDTANGEMLEKLEYDIMTDLESELVDLSD